jgi:hypothetical protein
MLVRPRHEMTWLVCTVFRHWKHEAHRLNACDFFCLSFINQDQRLLPTRDSRRASRHQRRRMARQDYQKRMREVWCMVVCPKASYWSCSEIYHSGLLNIYNIYDNARPASGEGIVHACTAQT